MAPLIARDCLKKLISWTVPYTNDNCFSCIEGIDETLQRLRRARSSATISSESSDHRSASSHSVGQGHLVVFPERFRVHEIPQIRIPLNKFPDLALTSDWIRHWVWFQERSCVLASWVSHPEYRWISGCTKRGMWSKLSQVLTPGIAQKSQLSRIEGHLSS